MPFMESPSNFKHFQKKEDCYSQCLSKLTIVEELIRPLTKKHPVKTILDGQHVKGS